MSNHAYTYTHVYIYIYTRLVYIHEWHACPGSYNNFLKDYGGEDGGRRKEKEGGRRGWKWIQVEGGGGMRKWKEEGVRRKREAGWAWAWAWAWALAKALCRGMILCLTLTPNAFSEDLCVSLSHFEHPRLENTIIY